MLYSRRDTEQLGQLYIDHVEAMTAEQLHHKGAIAAELAFRDQEIGALWSNIATIKDLIVKCFKDRTMPFKNFIEGAAEWEQNISAKDHPDFLRQEIKRLNEELENSTINPKLGI